MGEFTGFPYPEGGSQIYRLGSNGQKTLYADGFTQIIDLTFDPEGNLYVLEHAIASVWKNQPAGALLKITPDGTRTTVLGGDILSFPTALKFGDDGSLYITNKGSLPGVGQVLQVDLRSVPEPSPVAAMVGLACLAGLIRSRGKTNLSAKSQ